MIEIGPDFSLEERDIEMSFVRSSGPGGQHVNKVSTAVQLRIDLARISYRDTEFLARLRRLAGKRITEAGILIVESSVHRSQKRNRDEAISRLTELLKKAYRKPRRRRPTKPSKRAKERRLREKKRMQAIKQSRRKPSPED